VTIRYYEDDNGYLVYENVRTGVVVYVWDGDLDDAIETCNDWSAGPRDSPCRRLAAGDFSRRNLRRVLAELRRVQRSIDGDVRVDGDDYLDLLTTIESLEGIVARIEKIADE
jgi:hypothetical protein